MDKYNARDDDVIINKKGLTGEKKILKFMKNELREKRFKKKKNRGYQEREIVRRYISLKCPDAGKFK